MSAGGQSLGLTLDMTEEAVPLVELLQQENAGEVSPAITTDEKSGLNTFCQRYCRRAISKTDIVYTCNKVNDLYQAVVTLNCIDGIEFAGDVSKNQKDAEKNAAKQALLNYSGSGIEALPSTKPVKKRKATDLNPFGGGEPAVAENAKMVLNTALMRILRRALGKEDVAYETVQTPDGFQSTISLPTMPGEWSQLAWAGEAAPKKKDAEENAARHAVEALRQDASMSSVIDTPTSKAAKTVSGCKGPGDFGGKSGGKGGFWGGMEAAFAAWKGKMAGKGWGKGPWKGPWNGGGAWNGGGPKVRERLTSEPVTGSVLEWKDRYGWLTLHVPIEHEQASKNAGRVYLNGKDWKSPEVPMEGMSVEMHIYADGSGLGAEEASRLD